MEKLQQLRALLKTYQDVAIAYSGGCDSHFLYQVAVETLGYEHVLAVLCVGDMMSKEDITEAKSLIKDGRYKVVHVDVFDNEAFLHNRKDRCYFCKKMIMTKVIEQAQCHHIEYVLDGKNSDDESVYRPGIQACQELGIISPLSEVGMTKKMIRHYSQYLGISTYAKPANACLASRFPYDTLLTKEKLDRVSQAEALLHQKGIYHVRVRVHDKLARIEVEKKYFEILLNDKQLIDDFERLGFDYVTLDLKGITSGSYDR